MEAIKFKSDDINTVYELRKAAGVEAGLDIYEGLYHAFDLMESETEVSRLAASRFEAAFAYAMEHYSGEQKSPVGQRSKQTAYLLNKPRMNMKSYLRNGNKSKSREGGT